MEAIAGVATSIGIAIWQAVMRAGAIVAAPPAATIDTKTLTAGTVAMDRLAAAIEASSVTQVENNTLRREEHADRARRSGQLISLLRAGTKEVRRRPFTVLLLTQATSLRQ